MRDSKRPVYATINGKGQLVIPAPIRQELGISAGTRVSLRLDGSELILKPDTLSAKLGNIRKMRGITAGAKPGTELLLEDRRRERERESKEEGW